MSCELVIRKVHGEWRVSKVFDGRAPREPQLASDERRIPLPPELEDLNVVHVAKLIEMGVIKW